MASVFLSYDHEDADRAAPIAAALEKAGHSVWWDRHIHGGAEYNSEIEGAVERADAVVVLWSERSVRSAWVRDEAAEGRDSGKLVPVLLDSAKPPMGFRQYQTINLSAWTGGKRIAKVDELLRAIERVAGGMPTHGAKAAPSPAPVRERRRIPLVAIAAVALLLVAAALLIVWSPFGSTRSAAVAAVVPADSSAESAGLARELLAKLGRLQPAQQHTLELVGQASDRDDLRFEVAASQDAQRTRANLVLLNGRTGTLLWSKDFERPPQQSGDLRQELAYTAAQVLDCALEAHPGGRATLKGDTLKLYLNGCANLADTPLEVRADLIPVFRNVVAAAPEFEDGWSKLLIAEASAYAETQAPGSKLAKERSTLGKQLEQDIRSARKVSPDLAAAYAGEALLLPYGRFASRMNILDKGIAANPDDPLLLERRAQNLFAVGRRRDSINDMRRAVELDPISPGLRASYIFTLAQGGQLDAALQELQEAERLWPGSSSVADAKFAFHLRFGDPRIAWKYIQSGELPAEWAQAESYIRARIDPTKANVDQAIADARAVYERETPVIQHLVQSLSIFDREEEMLDLLLRAPIEEAIWVSDVTFRPAAREFWRDPRSLQYAKRVGLLDYWRQSGEWPDFCTEPQLPYDCKEEAARIS